MKFSRAAIFCATALASRSEGEHEDAVALQFAPKSVHTAQVAAVAAAPSPQAALLHMETLARSVAQGETTVDDATKRALRDVKEQLTETSEKGIKHAHEADEQLRARSYQAVEQCGHDFSAAGTDNAAIGRRVEEQAENHAHCRQHLAELIQHEEEKCAAMNSFLAALNPPSCAVPGRDGMAQYISALESYTASMKLQWPDVHAHCVYYEEARAHTREQCHHEQGAFEVAFCSFRQDMFGSCSEYKRCFSLADGELRDVLEASETNAGSRQIEWVAIQKIKCYVDVLLSAEENLARQSAMDTCHALAPNVDALKLRPITPLEVQACDLSPVAKYPCTGPFESDRYSGMAEIAQCQPCAALPAHLMPEEAQAAAPATPAVLTWTRTMPHDTTWSEMQHYCAANGERLCTRAEICPHGHSGFETPDGGKADGDSWVPIGDYNNGWVQTGNRGHPSCRTHTELGGGTPSWGTSHNSVSARHDVCCAGR